MATVLTPIGKVLYIDDDALNLRLVRKNLVHMGYEVFEEMDAKSGIEAARRIQPDVILMDVHMPGMTGLEATRRIKQIPELQHIPIIALTADMSEAVRAEGEQSGCDAHLNKPISRGRLLKVVGQFFDRVQM